MLREPFLGPEVFQYVLLQQSVYKSVCQGLQV